MKSQVNQLERMYDRLSPKERAILALQRWKADQPPDEALKRSTPPHDERMVWKYLEAARETETIVGGQASWLEAKLEAIQARLGILAAIRLFELFSDRLRLDVHFDFPALLTVSQHRERLTARRTERLSIEDAIDLLADGDEDDAERERQSERLRAAITSGELRAERGHVSLGELMDWCGKEVPVSANRAFRVAILPDELGEYVTAAEEARLRLVDCLDDETGEQHQRMARVREALGLTVAGELGQAETMRLVLEEVVAWAAGDFDGEEPISPELRADLDAAAERIRDLADQLRGYGMEVELPTKGDAEIVGIVKRAIAN